MLYNDMKNDRIYHCNFHYYYYKDGLFHIDYFLHLLYAFDVIFPYLILL